uniref:Dormancy-associated protein n=1 Tax=Codonopsis lanceolata TaxID=103999 RepID=Q5MCR5_9ASTR|nr:dormancy-associated protein [Codonopsis lanceolata]
MVLIDKLWDDVAAGPQPDHGLAQLRKVFVTPPKVVTGEGSGGKFFQRSLSMSAATPSTPGTPTTPSPTARKDNVWRSVFNPGSNLATKGLGSALFDKPEPNSPTVYDWLYSGETRSKHR